MRDTLLAVLLGAILVSSIFQFFAMRNVSNALKDVNASLKEAAIVSKDNNRILRNREIVIVQPGDRDPIKRGLASPQTSGKPIIKPQTYLPAF